MHVVLIAPLSADRVAAIRAVDPRLHVEYAWDLFGPELVADWPQHTVDWYLPPRFRTIQDTADQRSKRDALLAHSEVLCITFPFPTHLVDRTPRLKFVQQLPAGVSNLQFGDLWQARVPIASGRGAGSTLPIAEWAIAACMALAKELPRAFAQGSAGHLDRAAFHGRQVDGKTLGVIGVGGIGSQVARLAAGLGMHVLGVRRSSEPVPHVEQLFPPELLHQT